MGCWDILCVICGNTCHNDFKKAELKWLEKGMLLLANNENAKDCKEVSCNITFVTKDDKHTYSGQPNETMFNYLDPEVYYNNFGIFIHEACYKYVEQMIGIKLKFGDLPVRIPKSKKYVANYIDIDYKPISNYFRQFIEYDRMYEDGNAYMAINPLKNDPKNTRMIKSILARLHLTKEKRTGPTASATFYEEGDIKLGNNGKFWIIKGGKWMQLNEELICRTYTFKKNNKHTKLINRIPQLGEFNTELLFVKNFSKNKNTITIDFIGTNKTLQKLGKYV